MAMRPGAARFRLTESGYLGTLFSGATYNALGGMTGWTFGNGWQETSTFTKRGLLQSRTDTKGTAYPQFTLGFAPNGNVLSANDKFNGNWTYTYDDFNRLAGANQNTGQTVYNYKYDRYSNRWQQNLTAGSGQTSNLSFSGNNNRIDASRGLAHERASSTTDSSPKPLIA
jgi:YD repeat-containing protein